MSGFSIDWLDLREAADHRARDKTLLGYAGQILSASSPATVVDLGAGTGSTLRAFAEQEDGSVIKEVSWRLLDQDAALLQEVKRRHGKAYELQSFELDLTDIDEWPLDDAILVTASALFDLVSADFIDALVSALDAQPEPPALYSTLNYDGTTLWAPLHELDETVLAAFNRDQQTDKGFGRALGPEAGAYTRRQLEQAGYQVFTAASPWQLDGGGDSDQQLLAALIDGIAAAVSRDPAIDPVALKEWLAFRQAHVATGSCIVGHMDLLAVPEDH